MVGKHAFMFLCHPSYLHQENTSHRGINVKHFERFTSFLIAIPPLAQCLGFHIPWGVPPEPPDSIMTSKAPICGDHVQQWPVRANACTGRVGVQSLHHHLCEIHLPTLSDSVRRLKAHPTIFPIGDPTSGEVRSTIMTSHYRGLLIPEAMQPFFKPPHIIVLPGEGGAMRKVDLGRDIKSLASFEPM